MILRNGSHCPKGLAIQITLPVSQAPGFQEQSSSKPCLSSKSIAPHPQNKTNKKTVRIFSIPPSNFLISLHPDPKSAGDWMSPSWSPPPPLAGIFILILSFWMVLCPAITSCPSLSPKLLHIASEPAQYFPDSPFKGCQVLGRLLSKAASFAPTT